MEIHPKPGHFGGAGSSSLRIKMLRRGRPGGWMDSLRQTIAQHGLHKSQAIKGKQSLSTGKRNTRFCLISLIFSVIWTPNLIVPDKTLLPRIMTITTMH